MEEVLLCPSMEGCEQRDANSLHGSNQGAGMRAAGCEVGAESMRGACKVRAGGVQGALACRAWGNGHDVQRAGGRRAESVQCMECKELGM